MKRSIQHSLIVATLFSSLSVSAAPKQQVTLTTKANISNSPGKIELNAVFDSKGETSLKISDPNNPNKVIYDQLTQVLAGYGALLPGLETGPNRESLRVLVDSIQDGVGFPSGVNAQPKLINQILDLHAAFAPYWKDYSLLSSDALVSKYGAGLYAELNLASSEDLSRFLLCTGLDYKANVTGEIVLPAFIKRLMKEECTEFRADIELLESATSLADSEVQKLATGTFIFDYPEYWSPTKFSKEFEICENLVELDALTAAGWVKTSQRDISLKQDECRNYLNEKVLSRIDEFLTKGMTSSVLKRNITPYYRAIVEGLLKQSGARYITEPKALEKEVGEKIKSALTIDKGFTISEAQASFFNTEAFMKAIQKPVQDPMSLIAVLMSAPEGRQNDLRKELALASEHEQLVYTEGLVAALGSVCKSGPFTPSCIYAGTTRIDSQLARVSVQSGVEATPVWTGFRLLTVIENKEEL